MAPFLSLAEALLEIAASGLRFYVYVLHRPTGEPFYVGKGTGDRIAMHERDAARPQNDGHRLRVIRQCVVGGGARYRLVGHFGDEAAAFEEERRLIAEIGRLDRACGPLVNHTDGGEGTTDLNEASLRKRVKSLRAAMKRPGVKEAALAVLAMHRDSPERKAKAAAGCRSPGARAATTERLLVEWQDPAIAERRKAGTRAAQDLVWKANHAAGIARINQDDDWRRRRLEAWRAPEVQARLRASRSTPEAKARQSALTSAQRARQEVARRRVLGMAAALDATCAMPNHRSGLQAWLDTEARLFAAAML